MADTEKEPKKKGGLVKKLLIPLLAVVVLGGGGAAAGFFAAGMVGGKEHEDPNAPKVVLKDGTTVSAKAAGLKQVASGSHLDAKFKVTYLPIEEPFTANLRGDSGFAQMSLAVSTYFDDKVPAALTEHTIAIRSAILMTLSEFDSTQLESLEGKEVLKGEIKKVINDTLVEKTGFAGVEDVYFTSFVVQ
ncbi:flagellar basal body-associated FliL family protein [Blastomonas sp. AAP53]|uniref:flagellar basal body-associated FliL family protein n=1 Tax=Blastomonas sp. AAP53 TaxID=1248760 RepID=UPI0003040B87|nr:flagellar basal body-associated FliL family protein [Blastomonas sp. AAP53]